MMSLKSKYPSKEALIEDIIRIHGLPDELKFDGFNQYNMVLFKVMIEKGSATVSDMSEIVSQANFIDRYYQSLTHLVGS